MKGLAVLLMIQVHILELFASQQIFESTPAKILLFLGGPPVAPLFVFFLGYFSGLGNKSSRQLILRGVGLFVLGMLLNLALNANLIVHVSKGQLAIDLMPYIFGVDVLHLAGLSMIVIGLIKKILDNSSMAGISLILLIALGGNVLKHQSHETSAGIFLLSFFTGISSWSYFPLVPWLAYPLAGYLSAGFFRQNVSEKVNEKKISLVLLLFFLLFLAFTIRYAVNISSNLENYYHHGFLFVMWVIVFIGGYYLLIQKISGYVEKTFVARYVKWLGKNVTAAYVIQWIIIGNIATEVYKIMDSPFMLALWYAGILVATSILLFCWLRIKTSFLKKFRAS